MQKETGLQDIFLRRASRERSQLTVFLMNGFQMKGVVTGFDSFTVILETEGRQQLIYKHAISTMVPTRALELLEAT